MKINTTSGSNGIRRVRSLVAFRHDNSVGRLVSTVVALAVAMLLVVGTGAAYADDTEPAQETTSTDAAATDESPAPAEVTDAPSEDAAAPAESVDEPAAADAAGATDGDAAGKNATAPTSKKTTISSALAKLADVDPAAAPSDPSWIWQGSAPTLEDGEKDDTAYGGGSSEDTNPSTWSQAGADTPKADLLKYYFNVDSTSDIIVSFGFTRASINGDTAFAAEFNQASNSSNTPPRPVRTVGDVLLKFHVDSGNATLEFVHAFIWTDEDDFAAHEADPDNGDCEERYNSGFGWCEIPRDPATFDTRIADDGYTAEAQVNLTDLFGGEGCSAIFHAVNLRGESSAENWTNSLQDYLPLPGASVPSTCATLVINKYAAGTTTKLSGAHFDVYAGSDTTGTKVLSDVYDGKVGVDEDQVAGQITVSGLEPGTYTVEETAAPGSDTVDPDDDYFLADPSTITLTVAKSGTASFDFYDVKKWQPLDISKNAAGTFGAKYNWAVEKQISLTGEEGTWNDGTDPNSPLVKHIEAGGDTNLYYKVVVTEEGVDNSAYVVTGTIHVDNPNNAAVEADLAESLAGCTLDSNDETFPVSVTVPAGGADYAYTCDLGNDPQPVPDSNTATVTWDISTYPQAEGDIGDAGDYTDSFTDTDVPFTESASVDKTITVTDDLVPFDPAWVITWGDDSSADDGDGIGVYESDVYSVDTEAEAGTCSDVLTNTATITGDEDVLDESSESGQVCVEADLTVSVSALETLTRTFLWDIDKSTSTPAVTVDNGQATAHYRVVITALPFEDGGWDMSGTVTITNPNLFTAKQVSSLDVAYSGGGTCEPTEALPLVAANSSAQVDFDCDFGDPATQPSYTGDVTATVQWDGDAESASDPTPVSVVEADWLTDATLVDEFVKVFDDHAVPGSEDPLFGGTQLQWQDVYDAADHQVAVEYNHTFTGAVLPAAGACVNLLNTARFTGDDPELSLGSDDASVRACTPAVLPPAPPEVIPPTLPNTGGPDMWLVAAGLLLLLGGGSLVAGDRLRRRRS
jgi:large repetitive protein